jgi:acyl-CoA synthetase (NDP forming)
LLKGSHRPGGNASEYCNCLPESTFSPVNTSNNLVVGFDPHEKLKKGSTSLVFQSGLYEPRLDWISSKFNLGISRLIDPGNRMDINGG